MRSAHAVSKRELAALYAHRWQIELDIRSTKITLVMTVLRGFTAAMVEKELSVCLITYNRIRLPMAQAAHPADNYPHDFFYKHAVQMWSCQPRSAEPTELFRVIAQYPVGNRPRRS